MRIQYLCRAGVGRCALIIATSDVVFSSKDVSFRCIGVSFQCDFQISLRSFQITGLFVHQHQREKGLSVFGPDSERTFK